MRIDSSGTEDFWRLYRALPEHVRLLAHKNYRLWAENPFHPSLRFKPLVKPNWSVRVGDHHRAVGHFIGNHFLWEWIGSHEEYNKRF